MSVSLKTNSELKNIPDFFLSNYEKVGSVSTTCEKEGDVRAGRSEYNEQSGGVVKVLAMEFGQNHVSRFTYHVLDTACS